MQRFLFWWINFWKTKKITFVFSIITISVLLFFTALKINLNEDITQIFTDKKVAKILSSYDDKKVIILINPIDTISNINLDEIKENILNELDSLNSSKLKILNINQNLHLLEKFYRNTAFYLDSSDYSKIKYRLNNIDSILVQNHKKLFSINSVMEKELLFKDPLNINSLILENYSSLLDQIDFDLSENIVFTGDLLNTDTETISLVQRNLNFIKNKYKKNNINISFFSISFISNANSTQIKSDLKVTLSITILIVLLILIVTFKNYILPVVFIMPGMFGMLFSLTVIYLIQGEISAIALGSGAVIFGIVIDYSFHYFSHLQHSGNNIKTISKLYKPLISSAFTTIMAFFALTLTNSSILYDFGLFTSFGLIGSLLFVLFVNPIISPLLKNTSQSENLKLFFSENQKKNIALFILAITIILSFKLNDVKFDTNIANLNFYPEELKKDEQKILGEKNKNEKEILIYIDDNNKETVKQKSYDLKIRLKKLKEDEVIIDFKNLSVFDPPNKILKSKENTWKKFWIKNEKKLIKKLTNFSDEKGYNKNAFNEFTSLISSKPSYQKIFPEDQIIDQIKTKNSDIWIVKSSIIFNEKNYSKVISFCKKNKLKYLDKQKIAGQMLTEIKDDFNFLLFYTSILVFLTLFFIYGRLELAIITFLPMLISWIWILSICAIFDIQFNFVNIIISTLIFGIGDDFAIFISDGYIDKYKSSINNTISISIKSILLSAITTIIAFGSLIFAKHPAINSIAPVAIIGMSSILVISIFVQPFLYNTLIINRAKRNLAPLTLMNSIPTFINYTIFTLGSLFLSFCSFITLVIPYSKKIIKIIFRFLIQNTCKLIFLCAINVKQKKFDTENLNFSKPSIIISNHQSFVDILRMLSLNKKLVLVVKDWVYNSFFFGRIVRLLDFITISQKMEGNLDSIKELINSGYSIMIFPEGKRGLNEKLGRFHKGTFLIAEKFKLDITPILLHGYGNTIKKNQFLVNNSIMSYKVLPRILFEDKKFGVGYRERTKKIKQYFSNELEKFYCERKDASYLFHEIKKNIEYKGRHIERQFKSIWKSENKYYSYFDKIIANNAKIYDIGCGYGFLSCFLYLRSNKRLIIGIDNDINKVNIANEYFMFQNIENLKFKEKNINNFKVDNADTIIINLNIKIKVSFLENCIKNLNNNGMIIIFNSKEKNNKLNYISEDLISKYSLKIDSQDISSNKAKKEVYIIKKGI